MQQTLFIVILAVVIALALAYRWKKKTENKTGLESFSHRDIRQVFPQEEIIIHR